MAYRSTRERIQAIQRELDVEDDGLVGPHTLTRIEDVIARVHDFEHRGATSLTVSHAGLDELVAFEISSAAYYRRRLRRPVWPGGDSGITIGIGYDLGYVPPARIADDWGGLLSERSVQGLIRYAGLRGDDARRVLWRLRNVDVPLDVARKVFFQSTLPDYARRTCKLYPGIERLPADAQAALLSLVYNRGTALAGATRREMKTIRYRVADGDLAAIAGQLRAMKRLWDPRRWGGLHRRRDTEADRVRGAERDYTEVELIRV